MAPSLCTGSSHIGTENPADPNSKIVESVFEDLTAYKNRNGGIWGRGEMHAIQEREAGRQRHRLHACVRRLRPIRLHVTGGRLAVRGRNREHRQPQDDAEKAYGRSLPKPTMPDFPIRGYEYYDYRHDVVNATFGNFKDNATRKTGAISYLLYTSFGVSTENSIEDVEIHQRQAGVFPADGAQVGQRQFAGSAAWKTAVIHDKDGSVGGVPNSYILINDGVNDSIAADAEDCEIKPDLERRGVQGRYRTPGCWRPRRFRRFRRPSSWRTPCRRTRPSGRSRSSRSWRHQSQHCRWSWRARRTVWWTPGTSPPPVVLSRNGKDYTLTQSNVRAGTEIKLTTERPSVNLILSELDKGSWVIIELPGFTTAASGTPQDSLDALRKASDTSYYKDKDALWVKVVSAGGGAFLSGPGAGSTSVQVSR